MKNRTLKRNENIRSEYLRILVITEGEKTEPLYLKEIRKSLRISSTHIAILRSEKGTDPLSIVEYAIEVFNNGIYEKELPAQVYDRVYVVFDRDEHKTFLQAIKLIEGKKLKNNENKDVFIQGVISIPCFELWILLHFKKVNGHREREAVYRELKEFLPKYSKGFADSYKATVDKLEIAYARAKTTCNGKSVKDEPNPYTNVWELVELLHNPVEPDSKN